MSFGNILKKIRQENGLTQEELAQKVNTARSNIANYENDKNMPSVEILKELSKYFNCSIDYLLGKTDKRNDDEKNKKELEINWALNGGYDALNDENKEIAKSVIKGLLAQQEQEKKKKEKNKSN